MEHVRYVRGARATHDWTETFVETPEDGSEPTHYWYLGNRIMFTEPLSSLVARQAWMRAIDPDLEVDEGL